MDQTGSRYPGAGSVSRALPAALGLVLALLAFAAAPQPASAARGTQVSFMDDQLLLGARTQSAVNRRMDRIVRLGVDRLRVSAFWRDHAPGRNSKRRPNFNARNPYDPRYQWAHLDRVVSSAASRGLAIMMTISTPAPDWATRGKSNPPGVWRPRPREFALFAEAVARRYGRFVDHYGLGNEPNWPGWLQPQRTRSGRLYSPHLYRRMVQLTYPRLKAADRDAFVLIGETAPYGGRGGRGRLRSTSPLSFYRHLACRKGDRNRRMRHGFCRRFRPVVADAIGTHPYSLFTPPHRRSRRSKNDAGFGDLGMFTRGIDRISRKRGLRPARGRYFGIYLTEYGYQTNPPDPFAGVSPRRQRRYLMQAAYLAWKSRRIHELNQFRLTDGAIRRRERGRRKFIEFQSGLLFRNFRPKPAHKVFPHPIWIVNSRYRRGQRIRIWGQVRRGGAHSVSIQFSRRLRGPFKRLVRVRTNRHGYFFARARGRNGWFRYHYDDGPSGNSMPFRVKPKSRARR